MVALNTFFSKITKKIGEFKIWHYFAICKTCCYPSQINPFIYWLFNDQSDCCHQGKVKLCTPNLKTTPITVGEHLKVPEGLENGHKKCLRSWNFLNLSLNKKNIPFGRSAHLLNPQHLLIGQFHARFVIFAKRRYTANI